MSRSIYDFTLTELQDILVSKGEKKFRATQIYEWLYKKNANSFEEMRNISKKSIPILSDNFNTDILKVEDLQESSDGTKKFLFRLHDGHLIETVLMQFDYGQSVCISTQVGCNMGCAFCASGIIKKNRDLEVFEMVLQVKMINDFIKKEGKRVSHIVVMGIGEPFDNFDKTMKFIQIVNTAKGLEIGSRHITVSTCGIVPKILKFKDFPLQVNLAISLHFPNDEKRRTYMPIARTYNLESLMDAIDQYFAKTSRRITFEYILIDGINDSIEDARELERLIRGKNSYVNLIPMNETTLNFKRSTRSNEFFKFLKSKGINVTLRQEHGSDIDAACGQLRINTIRKKGKYEG